MQEAARWLRVGAEGGDARAMVHLAACLDAGKGVEPDPRAATEWLERAAALGEPSAKKALQRRRR